MRVRAAIVPSVRDLLEHPAPLLLANVVWGAIALVAWTAWLVSPVSGLVLTVVLGWPAAVIAMVAARVVRGEPVAALDALRWPLTRGTVPMLALGAVLVVAVALVDVTVGLGRGDVVGLVFATVAGWAVVALVALACVVWPILGDPRRQGLGIRRVVRLAVAVAFLHTLRVTAAGLLAALVIAVSTILVAPVLTVSLSLVALMLCRVVLPLADALDPLDPLPVESGDA